MDRSRIPWRRIDDFLAAAGSARSVEGLGRSAVDAIERVLPFDANALFAIEDETGRIATWAARADCSKWMALYNDRFRRSIPCAPEDAGRMIDWREHRRSAFVADFLYPQGISRTITVFTADRADGRRRASLILHRSRIGPPFGDIERRVCAVLQPHLRNMLELNLRCELRASAPPTAAQIADRLGMLTRREAEVAALLCGGFTVRMVATALFISSGTVRKHIENIYMKLGLCSREELLRRAGVGPGATKAG
jgi:DNA-binding CsgD family transcriptional regulator